MCLEDIKTQIKSEVEEHKNLKAEEASLKATILSQISSNYENIVRPAFKELKDIVDEAYKCMDTDWSFDKRIDLTLPPEVDDDKYRLYIYIRGDCGVKVLFERRRKYDYDTNTLNEVFHSGRVTDDERLMFHDWLCSTDRALELVDIVKDAYIKEFFPGFIEWLKSKNEKLASVVETYRGILSASNTLKQKEDGTVEITIGGKRYKGTLLEE